jgi:hypothetical protein
VALVNDDERDPEGTVLPPREVMSLISPGSASVPGLGGLLGGDPTAGAPEPGATPAAGAGDLASGAARHAADGQQAEAPSVSDQPQSLESSSSRTASSQT